MHQAGLIEENEATKKEWTILHMDENVTCIINVPYSERSYTPNKSGRFKSFVCSEFGAAHDRYFARVSKSLHETIPVGPYLPLMKYEQDEELGESDILRYFCVVE